MSVTHSMPAARNRAHAPASSPSSAKAADARDEQILQDPRWLAVASRDRSQDGQFFYAVLTTRVYCRPGCPARTPKPGNVRFHATSAQARAAGFRACLRCRPDDDRTQAEGAEHDKTAWVTALCRFIESQDQPPSLRTLAARAGISVSHLQREFKAVVGISPHDYAKATRANRVRHRLASKDSSSITEVFLDAGFQSSGRFYEQTGELLGMTPSAYRKGGEGEHVRFAIGQCNLGSILVARSGRGVCAITLGDDPQALARDLQDRFPAAELTGDDAEFADWVARIVGFVEDPWRGLDLPLDVRGTAFQQQVWQALRAIPPGERVTYTEIAARIGAPSSVRAVGAACGANGIAVAIPCHRVVRSDGGLAGYRWGVERKAALLARERELVHGAP